MKLKTLFGNWTSAIKTFPISHILLLALTVICICALEGVLDLENAEIIISLILSLLLAFIISCYGPLFLIHSNSKHKNTINRIIQIGSIVLGGLYYLRLINVNIEDPTYSEALCYLRILPLATLGIPLIIALFHRKQESKIRASRTNLFLSIFFGGIASFTFRLGAAGVLASIEALFDIEIYDNLYGDLGFIAGFLLTGYFIFNFYLAFSENINQKSDFKIKPSRLRMIFGSFIFFPLTLIYLAIFIAYGAKILITGVWPKGVIIRLGIGYFSLGIISSYIIYPDKTKTHEIINKIIFISFILISLMMIGAILKRINQYGITINRCFVCYIIAFIIIFSILSLIFSNKRLISFVSTLSILSLISVYGRPINVNNISFNSQVNKLETLLSKENLSLPLNEGDLKNVDNENNKLIMGTIDELVENYSKDKIINKIINFEYEDQYRESRRNIIEFLGLDANYYSDINYKYRYYESDDRVIDISGGFSKLLNFYNYYGGTENLIIKLEVNEQEYIFDLSNYIDKLKEKSDIYYSTDYELRNDLGPALILEDEDYKLVIQGYGLEENEGNFNFNRIRGYLLTK